MSVIDGTHFDYEKFKNKLEEIKAFCSQIKELSEKKFEKKYYVSGPAKGQIDLNMNKSSQMTYEFIPHLDELIKKIGKVLDNYLQSQEDIKNVIEKLCLV